MSAFVVSRETIDVLVCGAQFGWGRGPGGEYGLKWWDVGPAELRDMHWSECHEHRRDFNDLGADQVGAMLWAENRRSVDYRYEESELEPLYLSRHVAGFRPTPVEVLKACDCYEYQSCEHPEWPRSEACSFVEALRGKAIHGLAGYGDAPWDWSTADVAARRGLGARP